MQELSLQISKGLCPLCESPGLVGQPCLGPGCVRQGVAYLPAAAARKALEGGAGDREGLIGQFIGDYLVIERLGKGGFGRVLLGLQRPLYRLRAAVKLLEFNDPDPSVLETVRTKFEREAAALAVLESPHVVRLLQYGLYEGRPFMAMEFVPGARTLRSLLSVSGSAVETRPPIGDIKRIIEQVLLGLEAAHRRGIIHRDIKPENIMLQEVVGDSTFVKLVDFGLAKLLSSSHETSHVFGTIQYMAPEQIAQREVGPWTDLFAVAVIAFEFLLGRRPYAATDVQSVLLEKLSPTFDPTANLAPGELSDVGVTFFRRALAPSADARFRSTAEFIAAWRDFADSMALVAGGLAPGPSRVGRALRENSLPVAAQPVMAAKSHPLPDAPYPQDRRGPSADKTHQDLDAPAQDGGRRQRGHRASDRELRSTVLEVPVARQDAAAFQTGLPLNVVLPPVAPLTRSPRRRHVGLAVALGVVVVASVALVVAGLSLPGSTPSQPASASDSGLVELVAETPVVAAPSTEVLAAGAPEVAVAIQATPAGAPSLTSAAGAAPTETNPNLVTLPVALHLTIRTRPTGAALVVDGREVGTSPYQLETRVGGSHVVTATAPGFELAESSFVATADQTEHQLSLTAEAPAVTPTAPPSRTTATPRPNGAIVTRPPAESGRVRDETPPRKPTPMTPIYIDD